MRRLDGFGPILILDIIEVSSEADRSGPQTAAIALANPQILFHASLSNVGSFKLVSKVALADAAIAFHRSVCQVLPNAGPRVTGFWKRALITLVPELNLLVLPQRTLASNWSHRPSAKISARDSRPNVFLRT